MKAVSLTSIRHTAFAKNVPQLSGEPNYPPDRIYQARKKLEQKLDYLVSAAPNLNFCSRNTESFVTQLALGMGRRIIHMGELEKLCEEHNDFHLGFIPREILGKDNSKGIFLFFDDLIPRLRKSREPEIVTEKFNLFELAGGEGQFGKVYRLETKAGEKYALKVYNLSSWTKELYDKPPHGSWAETARGLYFSSQPPRDLSLYYFGNPKVGYNLYEWLDDKMNVHYRPGLALHQQGFVCGDTKKENSIGGILCDHGGVLWTKQSYAGK